MGQAAHKHNTITDTKVRGGSVASLLRQSEVLLITAVFVPCRRAITVAACAARCLEAEGALRDVAKLKVG